MIYVGIDVAIAKKAKQNKTFDKVFGVSIDPSLYDELIQFADHQAARQKLFGNE